MHRVAPIRNGADQGLDKAMMQLSSRGERDAIGRDETGWAVDRRVDIISR